jgi:putative ABC transport system ATP-binding protein
MNYRDGLVERMEPSIFRYILRYSAPQQVYLLGVILVYYPFLYFSLELPKLIVNKAIENKDHGPPFQFELFGLGFQSNYDQVSFLAGLSLLYLLLVFINGGFKYYVNVYKGRMGERLLRRLRYMLYNRILRFPLPRFRKVSQGELIPIITAEVEPLGGFIGTAFADPLFFGGQLLIILIFIMVQDPFLGAAAIALYPFQMYVIPKMQRKVNQLAKRRVQNVRRLSDHIGETVSGIVEVHAHNTARYELSRFSDRLGRIYDIRYEIFRRKFFIKFLNNFIDKLTPFFFFSIGGYLVIQGDLTFGALVAVLAAYKDLAAPWKELLIWYQQKEDIRIKYDQIIEQFDPVDIMEPELLESDAGAERHLSGDLTARISLFDEDGTRILNNIALKVPLTQHVAILGDAASGKGELGMVLARLLLPSHGQILIGGEDLTTMPEAVTGRRIGYVGAGAYLANASIGDNLLYGLKHVADAEADDTPEEREAKERRREEALKVGNSAHDYYADWVDYEAAGTPDLDSLYERIFAILKDVELERDVYRMGVRGRIDPKQRPEEAEKILAARDAFWQKLEADSTLTPLVEPFDRTRYNANATVAENLLFGAPVDARLDAASIANQPYVRAVLDECGLTDKFAAIGRQIAETMVELFADLPPGHEFFQQYSFIEAEELPEYQAITERIARGATPSDEERDRLLALPFQMVPARHRLGLIDDFIQERLLAARARFAENLPPELEGAIAFFDRESYNPAATLQDNILFGKIAYGYANGEERVVRLVSDIVDDIGLRPTVIAVGLESPAGVGGSMLSGAQRQKLAIARCLLKNPDLLIINEAVDSLDTASQERLVRKILKRREGQGVIWVMNRTQGIEAFDQVVVLKDGTIAESSGTAELRRAGSATAEMLATEGV